MCITRTRVRQRLPDERVKLLFLKRLSDRFEDECEELVREGADPEDPNDTCGRLTV